MPHRSDTPQDSPHFGELRSLLHRRPSPLHWELLCSLLDHLPQDVLERQALPYARMMLRSWPHDCRLAPTHWLLELLLHEADPGKWSLVRALELTPLLLEMAELTPQHWSSPRLFSPLTTLSLHGHSTRGVRHFSTLLHHAPLSELRHLHVHAWHASPRRLAQLLAAIPFSSLESLFLEHVRLDHASLLTLLAAPWSPSLRRLGFAHNMLDDDALAALLTHPLPRLSHLDLSFNRLSSTALRRALIHPLRARLDTLLLSHNLGPPLLPDRSR